MRRTLSLCLCAALLLALCLAVPTVAERGDDSDRVSKNGRTAGEVGGAEVVLEYGRPKVRDREIWGGLVPYGKVWRTGANEATTVTFDRDVLVEGEPLAAGTYALFTIPTAEEGWTVIFNETAEQWGAYDYDPGEDALRVEVEPRGHDHTEEMEFVLDGGEVVLLWDELAVPFTVEAAG